MVWRVWMANNLKPHLVRTFKVSNDRQFVEKLVDVGGPVSEPPEKALCCAPTRRARFRLRSHAEGLPLKKGRCGTMTHDYKRNGTTTLFAALEVAEGRLMGLACRDIASGVDQVLED